MDTHKYVLIIQKQQKLLFLITRYEEETMALIDCDIDDVTKHIDERDRIVKLVDVLTKEILKLCPEGSHEYNAFRNSCSRSDLTPEIQQIFDLRQQFNVHKSRACSMDQEIIQRLKNTRDDIVAEIKENNSGQNANAAKFYTSGLSNGENLFFPKNKKEI